MDDAVNPVLRPICDAVDQAQDTVSRFESAREQLKNDERSALDEILVGLRRHVASLTPEDRQLTAAVLNRDARPPFNTIQLGELFGLTSGKFTHYASVAVRKRACVTCGRTYNRREEVLTGNPIKDEPSECSRCLAPGKAVRREEWAEWDQRRIIENERLRTMPTEEYRTTPHWATIKSRVLLSVSSCQSCGRADVPIDVHALTPPPRNYPRATYSYNNQPWDEQAEIRDCVVLCEPCWEELTGSAGQRDER